MNGKGFSRMPGQESGKLYSSNISALAVVGAAFGNQNWISVPEHFNGFDSTDSCFQKSLISGHENRKRGERNGFRKDPADRSENLAVCDNKRGTDSGLALKLFQSHGKLCVADCQSHGTGIKNIPQNLLLGKDQTSPGSGFINGNHQ